MGSLGHTGDTWDAGVGNTGVGHTARVFIDLPSLLSVSGRLLSSTYFSQSPLLASTGPGLGSKNNKKPRREREAQNCQNGDDEGGPTDCAKSPFAVGWDWKNDARYYEDHSALELASRFELELKL